LYHLFLSPHFDDAVLSCGATIYQLVQSGKPVIVLTVMGGIPADGRLPDSPIVRELHERWEGGQEPVQRRIREDEAAVASLGAASRRMGIWADCVYRVSRDGTALYPQVESLFGEIHPEDTAGKLLPSLVLPPEEPLQCIYAPLGAGHHVDHQIVRNWGLELHRQSPWVALKFYEEYPYIEQEEALDSAIGFFTTCEPPLRLSPQIVYVPESAVEAKLHAIRAYQSQLSTFWQSDDAMSQAVRGTMAATGYGEFAERFWLMGKA
jgi:LmbE family N-acetylglucosaminyl deacetylase